MKKNNCDCCGRYLKYPKVASRKGNGETKDYCFNCGISHTTLAVMEM